MKFLQKLGKALMIPVAVLPAAGLLLGISYALTSIAAAVGADVVAVGALEQILLTVGTFLNKMGGAVMDQLPMLFAIGVAFGMSKGQSGAAAMSGFVAFSVLTTLLKPAIGDDGVARVFNVVVSADAATAFGKVASALTGILSGVLVALVYNKFHKVNLPSWLAFFSGKRLIPLMAILVGAALSLVFFFIWPVVFGWISAFGQWLVGLGAWGAALFGFFNRLLLPTGLHHALNNVFWFDTIGINDLGNFMDNLPAAVKGTTGMYMAGFYPVMMFGLPAACLAFIHTAKPENKERVKGIMISAAVTAILVGITEPIEFAFMFVAPVLYGVHAVLTGISMFLCAALEATAGFGFSAGLVDFILSLFNKLANKIWIIPIIGVAYAFIYYFVFKILIIKMDLKTPGREDDEEVA